MENCSLFLLLCLTWSLFILSDSQLQTSQTQVLLQLKKHLEYPKQLEIWYDRKTEFCFLSPSAQVNISCQYNSVTELKIMGDKPASEVSDFHGFAIPNQTLSESFSMDSFVTTLSRLPSLKVLSLVSLGIWGPLPDKIHRLSSLEYLDLSSNFLFGSIPPKISTLVKLQTFALDDNFFNDSIPSWLDSLSNLTILSMRNNRLKGPFPSSIKGITTLTNLALSSNEITGKLPDLSSLRNLNVLDLSGNKLGSSLPTMPKGVVMAFLSNNSFFGEIPPKYGQLSQLQHIDVSFNMLSGTPPAELFSLPNIIYLNVASNTLSGSLSDNRSCGSNLKFVDISNNRLMGSLPSCLHSESRNRVVKLSGNCLSVDGRHQHPESYCRDLEVNMYRANAGAKGIGVLVSLIVGIAVVIVLLAIGFLIVCRRYCPRGISEQHLLHKSVQDNSTAGFSSGILTNARYISEAAKLGTQGLPACRSFTLEELKEATNNFDDSAFLGEGSYGKLFKGRLESGTQVAIRCLPTSKKYWIRNLKLRLDILAKIRHPHLVCILGHCIEVGQDDGSVNRVFLVYEYIPNGNFRSHLSEENCSGGVLNWSERLAVLIGICKAVHFLHTGVMPGFFHNRLKTNNILLNEHRMAKLGDYGLSIISEENGNYGAKGEDPKSWQMTRLEDDIYSFGLILLESMIGPSMAAKKEATLRDELELLRNQDGRARIMNPVVSATCSQESISIMISITNKCICPELWSRPSFEDILWNLQYAAQVQANADAEQRFGRV
ncbi:PREDICTED: probable inactive leucine-rich repeat receptor-like protein kinase At3g03770 isoform X2 [Theobroma cacao]|uniref:Probable inactive leucine-rich repeat receptor-like protein kinase At3g03770 isoform X2 n=1 Tax=Theobroma cacao TaxID=3641 RepID=A0AB32W6D5_THECC|nr:PREDICTED: probable inactive leucine-rich repeat receptor-like protein kinase At3g03770 isoform X2 [Theobroma cacao]